MFPSHYILVLGVLITLYLARSWYTHNVNRIITATPLLFVGVVAFLHTNTPLLYLLPLVAGTTLTLSHIYGLATFTLPTPPLAYCTNCGIQIIEANNLYFLPERKTTEQYCPDCRINEELSDLTE